MDDWIYKNIEYNDEKLTHVILLFIFFSNTWNMTKVIFNILKALLFVRYHLLKINQFIFQLKSEIMFQDKFFCYNVYIQTNSKNLNVRESSFVCCSILFFILYSSNVVAKNVEL